MRTFHVRLTDYYRGAYSLRELLGYVDVIVNDPRSLVQLEHDERQAWTVENHLIADVYHVLAGKRHPLVPRWDSDELLAADPETTDALALARAREDERQARLAAGTTGEDDTTP